MKSILSTIATNTTNICISTDNRLAIAIFNQTIPIISTNSTNTSIPCHVPPVITICYFLFNIIPFCIRSCNSAYIHFSFNASNIIAVFDYSMIISTNSAYLCFSTNISHIIAVLNFTDSATRSANTTYTINPPYCGSTIAILNCSCFVITDISNNTANTRLASHIRIQNR